MSITSSMSRRSFLAATALNSMALGLASRLQADDRPATARSWQPRYVLGSSLYGTTPVAEILPEVARSGAESIDIWPKVHGNQREQIEDMGEDRFAELLKSTGTRVDVVTRYDLGPDRIENDFPFAARFGVKLIVTAAGGPAGLTGSELKAAIRKFVERMRPTIDKAVQQNLIIGIENHHDSLIESPDSLKWLAELSPSPSLGVAFAPYHLPQDATTLGRLLGEIGPDRLAHYYAWQHGLGAGKKLPKEQELLQMPGRGDLDFAPQLAALRSMNYTRLVEIFMHPVPRGIPILDTTAAVTGEINRGRDYLSKCLARP